MNADNLPAIIINACGLGGALMGIAIMAPLLGQPASRRHALALVALLAIFAADIASSILDLSPVATGHPALVSIGLLLWPWIPVCLWIYVDALIGDRRAPGPYRGLCVIAAAGTLCYLAYVTLPVDARTALGKGEAAVVTPHMLLALAGVPAFFLLWVGTMLAVGIKTIRALGAHRRRMRELLSDVTAADLRWIDGFMLFVGIGTAVAVADNLLTVATGVEMLDAPASALFEAGIVAGLVLFGVHQDRAVPAWADAPDVAGPAPDVVSIERGSCEPVAPEPRYARSSLTAEDCAAIVARLDAVMRSDEPWRNPLLDLKMLAERIATRPYYVTQALNTACGRNFYDYVNGWRVRAAAAALAGGGASVLDICEDVGFNAKSTFNAMFRKEMGMTPTAYRRTHRPPPPP